ncbi:MAG: hypothetical protein ACKVTZ_11245 [Bacteroidia bacterium]
MLYHTSLCNTCKNVRLIKNERGSVFYLCQKAKTDAFFTKYPPQPVYQCSGFVLKKEGSPSNVMLTKTCSGCFGCRKSAKTKFLQVIGQLKQPVQHYIYATTKRKTQRNKNHIINHSYLI